MHPTPTKPFTRGVMAKMKADLGDRNLGILLWNIQDTTVDMVGHQ